MGEGQRVLLLGCSSTKRDVSGPVQAQELYDGPSFRVFRRYLASSESDVRLYVFSGKYGLIEGNRPIEPYDAHISKVDDRFGPMAVDQIGAHFGTEEEIAFAVMSDGYLEKLRAWWDASGTSARIVPAVGTPGARLSQLRRWLYGVSADPVANRIPARGVSFRGQPVSFDHSAARETIVEAIKRGESSNLKPGAWYVKVENHRVGPKWLVARMTGTRPSEFHTHDALRVLRGLGFEVRETEG